MRFSAAFAAAVFCAILSAGCLVVSLQPIYDDESVSWDEALVGTWRDAEDNIEVSIERAEWRSYRIHYKHPIETGEFTAHLTTVGETRYLDLMPERGHDYGPLVVPVHAAVRVERRGDDLFVAPLDYDTLSSMVRQRRGRSAGLDLAMDQKQNVFITNSTAELRQWLRAHPDKFLGAAATFTKLK